MSIALSVEVLRVAPGQSVVVTARPRGGEAMLFTVDWSVEEGRAGGTLVPNARRDDGTYEATYTAPATGSGTFHLSATIREYPSAVARALVEVQARR